MTRFWSTASQYMCATLLGLLVTLGAPAQADDLSAPQDLSIQPLPSASEDSKAVVHSFSRINEQMQESLDTPLTGNADQDFATSMISNQQAAIDMGKVLLDHGNDPELRALAQDIVHRQQREMNILKTWLEKNTR